MPLIQAISSDHIHHVLCYDENPMRIGNVPPFTLLFFTFYRSDILAHSYAFSAHSYAFSYVRERSLLPYFHAPGKAGKAGTGRNQPYLTFLSFFLDSVTLVKAKRAGRTARSWSTLKGAVHQAFVSISFLFNQAGAAAF